MNEFKQMTNQELINLTIAALNCGDYSALQDADKARKEAASRGDKELIKQIDYLWEVI